MIPRFFECFFLLGVTIRELLLLFFSSMIDGCLSCYGKAIKTVTDSERETEGERERGGEV